MSYHYTNVTIGKLKILTPPNAGEDAGCRESGSLIHSRWECKMVQPLWKTLWQLLKKLNMQLLYDPKMHSWALILEQKQKQKTHVHIKPYT